jgi:hypothetical protein
VFSEALMLTLPLTLVDHCGHSVRVTTMGKMSPAQGCLLTSLGHQEHQAVPDTGGMGNTISL